MKSIAIKAIVFFMCGHQALGNQLNYRKIEIKFRGRVQVSFTRLALEMSPQTCKLRVENQSFDLPSEKCERYFSSSEKLFEQKAPLMDIVTSSVMFAVVTISEEASMSKWTRPTKLIRTSTCDLHGNCSYQKITPIRRAAYKLIDLANEYRS